MEHAIPPAVPVVDSASLDAMLRRARQAQTVYARFPQEKVDAVFRAAAMATLDKRIALAEAAVKETGMGVVEDKVIKNLFASERVYSKFKDEKTCGVVEVDPELGFHKVAEPLGLVAAIIPITNPTSTAIFKALLALKTRNGIFFSPSRRAKDCVVMAAKIIQEAAVAAGAPDGLIGWIDEPQSELTRELLAHREINLILATGGPGMVKAAYSSGKPAIGVGAGNTPVVVDEYADVRGAVSSMLLSKTFDNGMICASEQAVIAVDAIHDRLRDEFIYRGAYWVEGDERERLRACIVHDGKLNADIVGQTAADIARMAGFTVPEDTKILLAGAETIGKDEPLSYEKLSPVLALYRARDFEEATDRASELVHFAGIGHTAVLHTNQMAADLGRHDHIVRYGERIPTSRILVNQPAAHGAIGDLYNLSLDPSLTLGCGSWGGNSVSENVGVKHLLNVKTVTERKEGMLGFRVPPKVFFKNGCLAAALGDLAGRKRAFLVPDMKNCPDGLVDRIAATLAALGIETQRGTDIPFEADLAAIHDGAERMRAYQPDVILAVGGQAAIEAAKMMWLFYENPAIDFKDIAMKFMGMDKRIVKFPELGKKAVLVAVPTLSTGAEVTPMANVVDSADGRSYTILDNGLIPTMAVIDPVLTLAAPPKTTVHMGFKVFADALEAYVAVAATDFSNALALAAAKMVHTYLPQADADGNDLAAREKIHNAAAMAGMATGNAGLGLLHAMANVLAAEFHLNAGLCSAILADHVVRFNATDTPKKQTAFPQYNFPDAKRRYAELAAHIGLAGDDDDALLAQLLDAIAALRARLGIPATLQDIALIDGQDFMERVDTMARNAFDEQSIGFNPRYPLMAEIRQLYLDAFHGPS